MNSYDIALIAITYIVMMALVFAEFSEGLIKRQGYIDRADRYFILISSLVWPITIIVSIALKIRRVLFK